MKYRLHNRSIKSFIAWAILAGSLAGVAPAQSEKIGTVKQGLVKGTPVSEEVQQRMGLVSVIRAGGGACSGALIRQNWVLTAAHCLESGGRTMADDSITITLKATASRQETRRSVQIISFRPDDVAIIRVQVPFTGNEFANREIYSGDMTNKTIRLFGRGITEFSHDGNPSVYGEDYGDGFVDVISTTPTTYTFNARGGVMVGGGDSGGPSFVKGHSSSAFGATDMISGVHSLCGVLCAKGKDCSIGSPRPWDWVTAVPLCTDAAIAPLWPKIKALLEPSFQNQTFNTSSSSSNDTFKILYAVSPDGALSWFRHDIKYPNGKNRPAIHNLGAPLKVGSGWAAGMRSVMPMGQLGIYSLSDAGTLTWNWHLGFADGSFNWLPSQELAKGMSGFKQVIAQDEGIVYGTLPGGTIFWGATRNYDQKKGKPSTSLGLQLNPQNINFDAFKTIVGGGKGVFYAIGLDGRLYWMKHVRYLSPIADPMARMPNHPLHLHWLTEWIGPIEIGGGMGFNNVTQIFSPGDGYIYYVTGDSLVWRHYTGWEDGSNKWGGSNWEVIASGWGKYKFAFARNTTSDAGSGNPRLEYVVK